MKDAISIMAFSLVVGVFTMIGIHSIKRKKECDKIVILHDETSIQAHETTSYRNGMTYVVTCEGKKIQIPTDNIKMIK
jgi:hypothetical protein